jgi:hypothetical protein
VIELGIRIPGKDEHSSKQDGSSKEKFEINGRLTFSNEEHDEKQEGPSD